MSKGKQKKNVHTFSYYSHCLSFLWKWDNSSLADMWVNKLKSEKCIHVIIGKCKTGNMGQHLNNQEK